MVACSLFHRVALREKRAWSLASVLSYSLPFFQVQACSSVRRERKRVGVIITCRLWDRQFWKLVQQNHWDHFVKTLFSSPVSVSEEENQIAYTFPLFVVWVTLPDCYLHHHICVLLLYFLCTERNAAEKLQVNKVMFRSISFSCHVLSAEFIQKQKN